MAPVLLIPAPCLSILLLIAHLGHVASLCVLSPRDGRVSENTVCLIRKLLVLDPQQRLTASEVLDSLSSIIASWYVRQERGISSLKLC